MERFGMGLQNPAWIGSSCVGGERSILAETVALFLQGSSISKDSEFIWKTRAQRGNSASISSSKTPDSSTFPTKTR